MAAALDISPGPNRDLIVFGHMDIPNAQTLNGPSTNGHTGRQGSTSSPWHSKADDTAAPFIILKDENAHPYSMRTMLDGSTQHHMTTTKSGCKIPGSIASSAPCFPWMDL